MPTSSSRTRTKSCSTPSRRWCRRVRADRPLPARVIWLPSPCTAGGRGVRSCHMKMGRERNVLRWDAHAALLQDHIARTEAALLTLGEQSATPAERERAAQLGAELVNLRRRLRGLGPSPRAKMG